MPKRRRRSPTPIRRWLWLPALALLALALGEGLRLARSDAVQLWLAQHLGGSDPDRAARLVERHIREGLAAAGVAGDSVRAQPGSGSAPERWRVGFAADASLLQANHAITSALEAAGAEVLEGREEAGPAAERVTLVAGVRGAPTHELLLVRPRPARADGAGPPARLAIVLFGFGDDVPAADELLALPAPFAAAIVPGGRASPALFAAARRHGRETVLHLPLEPINYPQLNPGPGTLLVTMKPSRIRSLVRRYLAQAGAVSAVANHMGSLATQDTEVMGAVYAELERERLPFLHVNPVPGAVCRPLAADLGIVYEEPGAVLDAETRRDDARALEARWRDVVNATRARGRMLVFVRATPLAREWLPAALDRRRLEGISVVPLAALIRRALPS